MRTSLADNDFNCATRGNAGRIMPHNRIDVHSHYLGEAARQWLSGPLGFPIPAWTADSAIAFMDSHEIAAQILSVPVPLTDDGRESGSAKRAARQVNEDYAALVRERPDRFGAFASISTGNEEDSLAEIAYALDELHLDGVVLTSNSRGKYFGDDLFAPILTELNRRRVPVFVHPADNPGIAGIERGRTWAICEFPFDTARNIIDAIYRGVFAKYPDLRLILAHCGGALPTLGWRIQSLNVWRAPDDVELTETEIKGILRNFYYEIALAGGRQSLLPTLDITDASHILFGTDFPAAPTPAIDENIDNFTELQTQRETALAGVDRGNILELFPRFAAAPTLQEPRTGLTPSCAES